METKQRCQCKECKIKPHYSDCAVHNEPAEPNGECNCNQDTAEWEKELEKLKVSMVFDGRNAQIFYHLDIEKTKSFISFLILNTRKQTLEDLLKIARIKVANEEEIATRVTVEELYSYATKYGISLSDNQKI